jgi:hypothetical protein
MITLRSRLLIFMAGLSLATCRHTEQLPPHPAPLPRVEQGARQGASVVRVERRGELGQGALTGAAIGDFKLANGRVKLFVSGLGQRGSGDLVDGAQVRAKSDALRSLAPVVGAKELRRPRYERVDLEQLGGTATLRLVGTDPANPEIGVRTEYSLHPRSNLLRITTTIHNRSRTAQMAYEVGDVIDWGTATPFAPGIGHSPEGEPALLWIAAWSADVSYGYFRRDGASISARFDQQTVTVKLQTLEIPPRERRSVQRLLAVGGGGQIAGLLPQILDHLGVVAGRLHVAVSGETGDPLPGARVDLQLQGKPFSHAVTGASGRLSVVLSPGPYKVRASTADQLSQTVTVVIRPGRKTEAVLRTGPPSRLVFDVREEGSQSTFPAKLTLFGLAGTPTPWFGPAFSRSAVNTHLSPTGRGVLPLPPGRYRVIVSRGPEFSLHSQVVELRPHVGASINVRLKREVSTVGYLGLDIGQHSLHSSGCGVSPKDRVLSNMVEGLDGMVSAEAERAPGYAQAKIGDVELLTILGLSALTPHYGTLTAFPMRGLTATDADVEEQLESALLRAASPGKGPVIQLDGGRHPRTGLLTRLGYDPRSPSSPSQIPAAFGAMRVLDGQRPEDFDQLLEDWFSLLRSGRRITATGASGTRSIFDGEAGYPRTYVAVSKIASPELTVDQIIASLRAGKAVVSSGPFIELSVAGKGPGSTVSLPRGGGRRGRRRSAMAKQLSVTVKISAASWIELDQLQIYLNGTAWGDPVPVPGRQGGARLSRTFTMNLKRDGFVVALVRGKGTLAPVVAGTRTQLPPLALTNPVWIDVDGNGRFDP